ncbi:MAG: hypothetical protein ACI9FN_002339 [Saprospiraceae bacterium]|jgi:hypothetical protein
MHFVGQPIFSQLLNLIDRSDVSRAAKELGSDRYYKTFKTWDHLVCMLYGTFSKCKTIRELSTGLLACEGKLKHLGLKQAPRRSTISDGNKNRDSKVFEQIYMDLYQRYEKLLSDSRFNKKLPKGLLLADSTTIGLFKEILKSSGRKRLDGRQKGGIKAHTVIPADRYVASFIHYTSAATHDSCLLDALKLEKGDMICFDKAYIDYQRFYCWSAQGIYMVTRMKDNAVYDHIEEKDIPDACDEGVIKDELIEVTTKNNDQLQLRRVAYYDAKKDKVYVFISNNLELDADQIALIYKKRWEIEVFFRMLKQNFPLKYFLGDNQNAIEIQIWVANIAMLLMQLIKKGLNRKWALSNMVSMVRFHLMNYINLTSFLNHPERSWMLHNKSLQTQPDLFQNSP